MMRVAMNATALLTPLTGIGHYTRQLALGFTAKPEIDLSLFLGSHWSNAVPAPASESAQGRFAMVRRFVPGGYAARRLIQTGRFNMGLFGRHFDVYHEPNILPLPYRGTTVVTVHDLSWIQHPESHPEVRVRAMNRYFERGLRQSDFVLTDSEFVRQEVIGLFGYPADRMRAIPLGFERDLFVPRDPSETVKVLGRLNLVHGKYLLAVGTLEPRKNLSTALLAYRSLPAPLRARYPLVVVGMLGWKTSALEQLLAPLVQAGEVRQLGYLPREDLALVTAGASALVYPSLYEGFGLPPLEAMACGVPAITSNSSSLPEVVGDSALTMAPHDVDGLASHMRDMLTEPQLRQQLSERALARSRTFSWARCVEDTLDAYRLAAGLSSSSR